MTGKDVDNRWEKERIRLYLLASTISPAETGGLIGTPFRRAGFWERLFKRSRLH